MLVSGRYAGSKFVHPEWVASNKMKYAASEIERSKAEKLCDDIDTIIDDTTKVTIKAQREVDQKLEKRLNDVEHWKGEVSNKYSELSLEVDALEAYSVRVNKALESIKDPQHISHQCLSIRERRKGIELVHDEAEREMLKEVEIYSGVQSLLSRTQNQLVEQARLVRKMKYKLEKDLNNKEVTIDIDKRNVELKNYASMIRGSSSAPEFSKKSSSLGQWEKFSLDNIYEAQAVQANSANLRSIVDNMLKQIAEDMSKQKSIADMALEKRIRETKDAKSKLEDHLAKVKCQINTTEENLERLMTAISEKETPKKLTEKRLENRSFRPNVELCADEVETRLIQQSFMITQSIEKLEQACGKAKLCLKGLRQQQLELENDIEQKNETLLIDEAECMAMRKSIIIREF